MASSNRQRIVIAGRSPLSYFIATELDRQLGEYAHFQIEFLTDSRTLVTDIPRFFNDERYSGIELESRLPHTRLRVAKIKSINFNTQQITTEQSSIGYDFLILDQLPYYSPAELGIIKREFKQLLSAITNSGNGNATVVIEGRAAPTWQLSLALREYQHRHHSKHGRRLQIAVETGGGSLKDFLRDHGIGEKTEKTQPKLKLGSPMPYVKAQLIKGAKLDKNGRIMTDKFLRAKGTGEVICLDGSPFVESNLLGGFQTLSRQVVGLLLNFINKGELRIIDRPSQSLILKGHEGKYLVLGTLLSKQLRAGLVYRLEKRFHR